MDTDVLSSAIFTATGLLTQPDGSALPTRCRIVGVYYTASANGTIILSETSGAGRVRMPIPTTASASGLVMVPQGGVLFVGQPFATVTGTLTGAVVYYC